jgi:short-subunit dehydrogenase
MAWRYRDKRVIITGASSGIGAALARELAARGASVALAARRKAELERVAAGCRHLGSETLVLPTDVTELEQCRNLVEQTVATWGGVDLLVNNAGFSMHLPFEQVSDLSLFEELIRVNYLGALACTHFALPHLKASQGRILVVSSLAGKTGVPTRTGYAASKHALHGFFEALRTELVGSGVRITIVCPGFVATSIRRVAAERQGDPDSRPVVTGQLMSADRMARVMLRAAARGRREVIMTPTGKVGKVIRPFFPGIIDRIARKRIGWDK